MSSQLKTEDKLKILKGKTKIVGGKPYENGHWGTIASKDRVLVELLDLSDTLIDYKDFSIAQAGIEIVDDKLKLKPGSHLSAFGFETGQFKIRYRFIRNLAGSEDVALIRTKSGFEGNIYSINDDASNIYITDEKRIYAGTEDEYSQNPDGAEQLFLNNFKYEVDTISADRKEIRLKAKKISDENFNGYNYNTDFLKLQESTKIDNISTQIEFIGYNVTYNAGATGPPNFDLNDSLHLQITPTDGGFSFTDNLRLGTITLPNAFRVGTDVTTVRTQENIMPNEDFERISIDLTTGEPKDISGLGWDPSLHNDAIEVKEWSTGYIGHYSGTWGGSAHIGTHAKFVKGEGKGGGNCLKFIDQNDAYVNIDEWPTTDQYRTLEVSHMFTNLNSFGAKPLDIMNLEMDIKSTVAGKGVSIRIIYPSGLFVEEIPTSPPEGYWDPLNPTAPTETMPTDPPEGYVENTAGEAQQIESQPPNKLSDILTAYNLTFADLAVGDTSEFWGGAGVWVITQTTEGNDPVYTWQPNLISETYTKINTISDGEEWQWDGYGSWNAINATDNPSAPAGTVNAGEYPFSNIVNTHPYALPGNGEPIFSRETFPGQNKGWQTGTVIDDGDTAFADYGLIPTVGSNAFILLKDDLVWACTQQKYTTDYKYIYMFTIDQMLPAIRNQLVSDGSSEDSTHSVYNDIFKQGYIQSITRTKNLGTDSENDDKTRANYFVVFYNDGRGTDKSNKVFMVDMASPNTFINPGHGHDKVVHLKDLDSGLNDLVMESGGEMEWSYNGEKMSGGAWDHYCIVKGTNRLFKLTDGDGDFFEKREDTGDSWLNSADDDNGTIDFSVEFSGIDGNYLDVWFPARHASSHWSFWSGIHNQTDYIKMKNPPDQGITERINIDEFAYGLGEFATAGAPIPTGVRDPGADNYGYPPEDNPDGRVGNSSGFKGLDAPIYDDGTAIYSYDDNPKKEGTMSEGEQWKWNGDEWISIGGAPDYTYSSVYATMYASNAGGWDRYSTEVTIPENWDVTGPWRFAIRGHKVGLTGNIGGVTWVDNLYADFTLTDQTVETPIYRDYTAKIVNVIDNQIIEVNRTYLDAAQQLTNEDPGLSVANLENSNPVSFDNFKISYLVYNPYDLRTYIKMNNQMFLTTNFKKDKTSNNYPFSVVYKLYEELPQQIKRNDEVTVVKEMADVVSENVKIIDFVDTEVSDIVLKTPDLSNVESPVQRRATNYKTKSDVLTSDTEVSNALRNEFLSQSMDSAEINVDYSRFENFINFSSVKRRIENFRYKVQQIEAQKVISASYVGVSGSNSDLKKALNTINEYKTGFDDFEKYMYFQSSSYVTSSLGEFYDNAWPKESGDGTVGNEYVLSSTTSNKAKSWYSEQISSASIYDLENLNKLSDILPEHIKINSSNEDYLKMTDMFGHHFDNIWVYIKALGDTYDRREKLTEGISKDLLESVGKSLGWELDDGKSNISLSRFALGKEVTGSSYSNYSTKSEKDISREIWSRIINNMPFFLKNKGTIRAIRGLISIYGIPSTILRVKEYGGPNLPDDATPQFEINRKFTKALGFRGSQSVKTAWSDDVSSGRKPDTIEFRFKSPTGSNQILVEKASIIPNVSSSFYIKLKDNNLPDNYGHVAFQISGSDGMKEITSSNLPVYDNDFYSVMVRRVSGSDNHYVTQSFELSVGKYDAGRSKIHLYSTSTLTMPGDLNADSASYNLNWENDGEIYIGGSGSIEVTSTIGAQFSGSLMEYRHWTEPLNTGSFKNHIANPKAYNGNSLSSSYENLVLRYSFDDNLDLSTDIDGIRDISANQTTTYSGSHSGFTGNFFGNVEDQTKSFVPSIGALRRVTNKIRIEPNKHIPGTILSANSRATMGSYDTSPVDSNKIGVYFAPTDVINTDIIESVADLNFDNYLGDPRDVQKLEYRGLKNVANNYWKKYTGKNDFWDYIRLIKYYDQSIFPQVRKMIPARAKANLGILVEPNIFERPKVIIGKDPVVETPIYRDTIKIMDDFVEVTSSYNHDRHIVTDYDAYNSTINLYRIDSGSATVSMSAAYKTYEGNVTGFKDEVYKNTIWQRIGEEGAYKSGSVTTGDVKFAEVLQPIISGSRIYGNNQKLRKIYNTYANAVNGIADSSTYYNVDIDNLVEHCTAKFNSYYAGVKNTKLTTFDGGPPIEVTITSPTRLVKSKGGASSLDTGEGKVAKFLPKKKKKKKGGFFQKSFAKTKPSTLQKAIKQAEEDKGDFLTFGETMKVVNKFNKNNNIKNKKKKK